MSAWPKVLVEKPSAIKMHMDKLYGPPWHCIVGKGYGSAVTFKNKHFAYLYIANKAIMIYKH